MPGGCTIPPQTPRPVKPGLGAGAYAISRSTTVTVRRFPPVSISSPTRWPGARVRA
jgi:hypothetical protein